MATATETARTIARLNMRSNIDRGRARYLRKEAKRATDHDLVAILDAMLATPAPVAVEVPQVPWQGTSGEYKPRPLDGVDVAWLQQLPGDPAEMTSAQLVMLARLSQTVESKRDHGIVDEVFDRARVVHERPVLRARLEAELAPIAARAGASPPARLDVDTPLSSWLAGRLEVDVPELTTGEALARARRLVSDETEAAKAERSERAAKLTERLAGVDELDAAALKRELTPLVRAVSGGSDVHIGLDQVDDAELVEA